MFTHRIRKSALTMAGAALIATSLISSVAMASPSESQPSLAHIETVAAKPKLDLPRADGHIMLTTMELKAHPSYKFSVANHGPDRASFKVKVEAGYRASQGSDVQVDRVEETVTLDAGTGKDYFVECKGPVCVAALGEVKVVGVDPDEDDNTDYILH